MATRTRSRKTPGRRPARRELDDIRTSVAGAASGPERDLRQHALERMSELPGEGRGLILEVVPEPDNPYDADALKLMVKLPELGRVQLGYVRNADTLCDFCGHLHARYPADGRCHECGEPDLVRKGLASRVAATMRKDPTVSYYGEVLEVTGGYGRKANFGCNLTLRRRETRPASAVTAVSSRKPTPDERYLEQTRERWLPDVPTKRDPDVCDSAWAAQRGHDIARALDPGLYCEGYPDPPADEDYETDDMRWEWDE